MPAAPRRWTLAAAAVLVLGSGALAWSGGLAAFAGAVGCALGGAWAARSSSSRPARVAESPAPVAADGHAADAAAPGQAPSASKPEPARKGQAGSRTNPMITEVIPVWSRQLEATRTSADEGLANVLGAFTEMSGALDTLLGSLTGVTTSTQPGAVDNAVAQSGPQLSALHAPSMRAFEQRDAAVAELERCAQALTELTQLSRQAKEIGRHTRLVAFNASIEASRDTQRDGGNQAVAQEMRLLASRMGETGDAINRVVAGLAKRIDEQRYRAITRDSTADELRMEIDMRAREALQALMAALGASLSTSGTVRDASSALKAHLDEAFVQFQFGDRVSQMLAIVGNDMNNFVEWVARNPNATLDDASEWLQRLESSYTMEEQRSEHHGNVHVDRGSEVEFF